MPLPWNGNILYVRKQPHLVRSRFFFSSESRGRLLEIVLPTTCTVNACASRTASPPTRHRTQPCSCPPFVLFMASPPAGTKHHRRSVRAENIHRTPTLPPPRRFISTFLSASRRTTRHLGTCQRRLVRARPTLPYCSNPRTSAMFQWLAGRLASPPTSAPTDKRHQHSHMEDRRGVQRYRTVPYLLIYG